MILPQLTLKTFVKQRKKREYPESEQTGSYGTDGETAGRMATNAKFQSISQDQSAYNHWVGQMRVQLKTFAKQRKKKREHPESEQTDSYGTDGETAGRMATNAKFQSISQDQSAYNHWVGQMRVQLKTFAKQRKKKREHPESEQTDSYGTDGETAGRMATSAKFQSISQDQSAYNHWQMSVQPTPSPTPQPTPQPMPQPTPSPTPQPTPQPMPQPTPSPTPQPTPQPMPQPTPSPTPQPTPQPIPQPTPSPTPQPTPQPIPQPTPSPTPQPTPQPTPSPTPQPQPEEPLVHPAPVPKVILIHPEPDPDPPTCSKKPSKISKCCCCVGSMLLFVVLVLAVALAAWVATE